MTYKIEQIFETEYPPEAAIWCNENNAYIEEIEPSNDIRRFQIVGIPLPSQDEMASQIQASLSNSVQTALDNFAKTRNYDGIMSACSYGSSTDPTFKAEAEYCIKLRDETWRQCYVILDDVLAGIRDIPSEQQLLAELPIANAKWP